MIQPVHVDREQGRAHPAVKQAPPAPLPYFGLRTTVA